jgi:hypothetical protein
MIQRPEAHKARAACDAGKATKEATAEKKRLLVMMRCTYAGRGLHAFVIWAGMKTVRIFSDRIRDRIRLEGF